jgi:ketosteroid isomerase-like protein
MRIHKSLIAATFLASFTATTCAAQQSQEAEIIAASRAIVAAFGADDPGSYFKLFSPEATFIFREEPQRFENRDAYEQAWASWRQDLGLKIRSCSSSDQLVKIFGDVAVLMQSLTTEITTNTGNETLQERETIVFHRRDGHWIAVHEHLSGRPKDG